MKAQKFRSNCSDRFRQDERHLVELSRKLLHPLRLPRQLRADLDLVLDLLQRRGRFAWDLTRRVGPSLVQFRAAA